MRCANLSITIIFVVHLLIPLLALTNSTLALPNPAPVTPSNQIAGSKQNTGSSSSSSRVKNAFRKTLDKLCKKGEDCESDWNDRSTDFPTFDGAPDKKFKVEQRKKKKPDADPEDKDFCAGEVCEGTEECVQMKGHEKDRMRPDRWFTCCPKNLPIAGFGGKCCIKVDKRGVCTK